MTLSWSEWSVSPWKTSSPYVHWHYSVPPGELRSELPGEPVQGLLYLFDPVNVHLEDFLRPAFTRVETFASKSLEDSAKVPDVPAFGGLKTPTVPLPGASFNKHFAEYYDKEGNWAFDDDNLPVVDDPETVIVGIVDTGIALGHNRFREEDGRTRFLAAWQQTAPHAGQSYLPFGQELYRDNIDTLLSTHSQGDLRRSLDEAAFNDAAQLVNMRDKHGHREIAGRNAHGTAVADLAFGERPGEGDKRVKLIAVNLPDRYIVHSSGVFLDYFAIYGIKRIADLADMIFEKSREAARLRNDPRPWPDHRFPVIVNMSFGKNAGAKDGHDPFSAAVQQINDHRSCNGLLPVQMVIPVGNQNLVRGCAEVTLASGAQDKVTFITQPEDQTPNFLEIWTESLDKAQETLADQVALPLEIDIIPPGDQRTPEPSSGGHLQSRTLGSKVGRLYCSVRLDAANAGYKVGYLFCTAPTLWQESPLREASPSGRWTIVLRNAGQRALRVYLSAQTDQSILPRSGTGRLPRLEREDYEMHVHPSGRLRDSYSYPYRPGGNLDNSPVLRRHGSINAMSTGSSVIAVAGYRLSDGRPAAYSSTGYAYKLDTNSLATPVLAFPTDESPAHFGLLASGASNGSVVAMRGTSFAAALATRWVTRLVLNRQILLPDAISAINAAAQKAEADSPSHFKGNTPPAAKIGHGRIRERPARLARTMHPP
jgi:hypothetical protein